MTNGWNHSHRDEKMRKVIMCVSLWVEFFLHFFFCLFLLHFHISIYLFIYLFRFEWVSLVYIYSRIFFPFFSSFVVFCCNEFFFFACVNESYILFLSVCLFLSFFTSLFFPHRRFLHLMFYLYFFWLEWISRFFLSSPFFVVVFSVVIISSLLQTATKTKTHSFISLTTSS